MNEFTRLGAVREDFQAADDQVQRSGSGGELVSHQVQPAADEEVLIDYIPITGSSVLTQITIQFDVKDMQFKDKENASTATINIYGRISTLARRPLAPFEDVVTVNQPTEMLQKLIEASPHRVYQKTVPLQPGAYRLNIAAKDLVGGNTGTYEVAIRVPHLEDDTLSGQHADPGRSAGKAARRREYRHGDVCDPADRKMRPRIDLACRISRSSAARKSWASTCSFIISKRMRRPISRMARSITRS